MSSSASQRPPSSTSAHLDDETIAELALENASIASLSLAANAVHAGELAHLGGCPACEARFDAAVETFVSLELSAPPSVAPRALREGLLAASDPAVPFGPYLSRLARLFDLSLASTSKVVADLDDPKRWEPTLLDTVTLFHFDGGPSYASADNGFVRFGRGTRFPIHRHVGEEITLVLSGRLIVDDGYVLLAGERMIMADGSSHSFRVPDDEDALCAVRLLGHIEAV